MKTMRFKLDSGVMLTVQPPKLRVYNDLLSAESDVELILAIASTIGRDADYVYSNFTINSASRFILTVLAWVKSEKLSDPSLNIPYYPENGSKVYFLNNTSDRKIVSEYANISIPDTNELDVFTYWGLLHDAVVWNCNRTTDGREYLENAYNYAQTKPDRDALRENFGGGKRGK